MSYSHGEPAATESRGCFLLRAGAVRRAVQEMPAEQAPRFRVSGFRVKGLKGAKGLGFRGLRV